MANPDPELPRERCWQVRAEKVVLATGAIERHIVFPDNDRPGIMMASAAQTYLNRYGVAVGRNVAVYTSSDSAYQAAFDLKNAGIKVPAIIDMREEIDQTKFVCLKALPSSAQKVDFALKRLLFSL